MSTTYDRIDLLEMKLRIAVEALLGISEDTCTKVPPFISIGASGPVKDIARATIKAIDEARLP